MGYATTLEYLRAMALLVFEETGLMPHLNPGVMTSGEIASLREASVSMGIMLESASSRLMEKGGCHHGSPDKDPAVRLETMSEAGRQKVPFTSGILIGIGETRAERIEALLALRDQHDAHGHIQEVIIQNFRAKPGTKMFDAPEPNLEDLQWTIAVARLILGPDMSIQAPPNLSYGDAARLIPAGINDWGGVSPVTPDHVNPEAPWPHLDVLTRDTAGMGKILVERLSVYPDYARDVETWLDPGFRHMSCRPRTPTAWREPRIGRRVAPRLRTIRSRNWTSPRAFWRMTISTRFSIARCPATRSRNARSCGCFTLVTARSRPSPRPPTSCAAR